MKLPLYGDISTMRQISATVTERFPQVSEFLAQVHVQPKIWRKQKENKSFKTIDTNFILP